MLNKQQGQNRRKHYQRRVPVGFIIRRSAKDYFTLNISVNELEPTARYRLINGIVAPRPIAVVSTLSVEGKVNLAPFSYFNAVGADPLAICFSISGPKADGGDKDTLVNIQSLGEFVISGATDSIAEKIAKCAAPLGHGESEFEFAGLTPAPSFAVRPPRIAESPVSLECSLLQIVPVGSARLVIGEVIHIWADESLLDESLMVRAEIYSSIARMGGEDYLRSTDRFTLPNYR